MMWLNLTNANASLSPHAIRNSNAASVPSASFLRKQSCYNLVQDCSISIANSSKHNKYWNWRKFHFKIHVINDIVPHCYDCFFLEDKYVNPLRAKFLRGNKNMEEKADILV